MPTTFHHAFSPLESFADLLGRETLGFDWVRGGFFSRQHDMFSWWGRKEVSSRVSWEGTSGEVWSASETSLATGTESMSWFEVCHSHKTSESWLN